MTQAAQTQEPENIVSLFCLLAAEAISICDKCSEWMSGAACRHAGAENTLKGLYPSRGWSGELRGPDSGTHGPLERLKVSALAEQLDGSVPEHKQSEESPDLAQPADLSVCKFPSLHSWRNQLELKKCNCCRSGGFFVLLTQESPTRSSCERPYLA